jgi:hypothetical protein
MTLSRSAVWGTTHTIPSDIRQVFDRFLQQDESDSANATTSSGRRALISRKKNSVL